MSQQSPHYRIGQAAQAAGLTAASIRFYEQQGLLEPGSRTEARYRLYGESEVHRLRFIRLCRALDMSLEEVKTLLGLDRRSPQDCSLAQQTLDAHLGHVRERLNELQALERELLQLRQQCDGRGPHCGIVQALHQRADAGPPGSELRAAGLRHV
jgi:DNA-binding transcriptional MerR regulator